MLWKINHSFIITRIRGWSALDWKAAFCT